MIKFFKCIKKYFTVETQKERICQKIFLRIYLKTGVKCFEHGEFKGLKYFLKIGIPVYDDITGKKIFVKKGILLEIIAEKHVYYYNIQGKLSFFRKRTAEERATIYL